MLQNNIDNEFISKLVKEPLGDAFSVKKTEEDKTDDIQKVRYLGGEEVKDSNGEVITEEKRSIIPPFNKKEVPLIRKKGEPENAQELSQDIRKEMDSGSSFNEAWEKEMKKYPGTAKNINEFYDLNGNVEYHKEYPYTNGWHIDNWGAESVYTPKEAVEVENLKNLGISSLLNKDSSFIYPNENLGSLPATRLYQYLVKNKALDEWKDVMSNFNPSKFLRTYNTLRKAINEDKDKEFTAEEKYDISKLLNETMVGYSKWLDEVNKQEEKAKTPKPETRGSFTTADGKTTDVKYPTVATLIDKNGNETVIDSKQYQENREKDAINEVIKQAEKANKDKIVQDIKDSENKETETPSENKTTEEVSPAIENEESINAANKAYLASLQEKDAKELEAEREVAEERAKRIMTQLDKATAYEEWLKNPTIISGIFGKSGLSTAKKIGLGAATLFAIASDVMANYAKGLNNETSFSNQAVAELNKYVDMVNKAKAEKIGERAGKPYVTDAENEEKLNQSVSKLKRTNAGIYIPDNALRFLVQNAQLGKELIKDEKDLAIFLNQAEKGFIKASLDNEKEASRYVDENNTLTP